MNKQLVLSAALALAGVTSGLAGGTNDIYVTGSTAFRANVYTACQKMFSGTPTIFVGDAAHGGGSSGTKAYSWVMTGTPITALTNFSGATLTIHGLFTGSVQGYKSVVVSQPLIFAQPVGSGGTATQYITNAPTIGFSDCSGGFLTYNADGTSYTEDQVCVQPFVIALSAPACPFASVYGGPVTNISNVTWEQLKYGIGQGKIPASTWSYNPADTNTFIYMWERTQDSGTRATLLGQEDYGFSQTVQMYLWDQTNHIAYSPKYGVGTSNTYNNAIYWASTGIGTNGGVAAVLGSENVGNGNANMQWGAGYIGGGDIANALADDNITNQSFSYLSIGDAKGAAGKNYWGSLAAYNGQWPSTLGASMNSYATNASGTFPYILNYAPITLGTYPCWGYEVCVYPFNGSGLISGQDITYSQLGTSKANDGSFMAVFNAQTLYNGGTPTVGSIENEIYQTELTTNAGPATAIRLSEMVSYRGATSVGGLITP